MARPKKKGLDYFPLDVDFFDDPKIAAISGEFGAKGELVALRLLCAIYRNGYFAEWSDMLKMKLVRDVRGVSEGLLEEIVKRLVRWEFFDKGLFDSLSILTSRGIQKRYFSVARRRVSVAEIRYLLVSVDINDSKTEFLHTETGLMSTETPQRKENKSICIANTKESKREKSDEAAGASSSSRNVDARDTSSQSLEEKRKSCAKRKETFFTEVMSYVARYGERMCRNFFDYWSEQNKSLTKMRFELERTWSLERRLSYWESRERIPSARHVNNVRRDVVAASEDLLAKNPFENS